MFVLTRRSALPRLRLVPGGLARWHDGRVTLLALASAPGESVEFSLETAAAGGCAIVMKIPDRADEVVARYPSRRLALRQLQRLLGDAGWSAAGWLWRALLLAALLFVAWFLFFVPGDLAALSAREGNGVALEAPAPFANPTPAPPPAAAPTDGPAFIDDPADPRPAVPAAEFPPVPAPPPPS